MPREFKQGDKVNLLVNVVDKKGIRNDICKYHGKIVEFEITSIDRFGEMRAETTDEHRCLMWIPKNLNWRNRLIFKEKTILKKIIQKVKDERI